MKIEIITSPNDKLKETGFGSYFSCANVMESIERIGHIVTLSICQSMNDLEKIVKRNPDLVVLAVKYISVKDGDDIWLSEYFSKNNIVFSGSIRETLNYDSDKVLAKSRLDNVGIKTAKYFTATPGQYQCEDELPLLFPLFIKPISAANGNGIDDSSFVKDFIEFESKVSSLHDLYKSPVLVEEYLSGREFTVAIIKTSNGEMIVSAIEIIPPESIDGLMILGAGVKKSNTEKLKKIEEVIIDKVKNLAIDAFTALGVRGFGRIDVKMNGSGQCFFMEANLVPGMNLGSSYFPMAYEIANEISYDEVVHMMLDESFGRFIAKPVLNSTTTG